MKICSFFSAYSYSKGDNWIMLINECGQVSSLVKLIIHISTADTFMGLVCLCGIILQVGLLFENNIVQK